MSSILQAIKKTASAFSHPKMLVLSALSDLLFLLMFGWAVGVMLMSKMDGFLQALQSRLTLAAGAVSEEVIEPTFFSDMLAYDPLIKETLASFGLFMLYSAAVFYCLYVSFQAISWYLSHRMAGNNPDMLRFLKRFMIQSAVVLAAFFFIQAVSLLVSINSLLSTTQRGGDIPQPVGITIAYAALVILAISLYAAPNLTFRKGAVSSLRGLPAIIISIIGISGIFIILGFLNGWLNGSVQFFFQALIIVPSFTLIRVFFVSLSNGDQKRP